MLVVKTMDLCKGARRKKEQSSPPLSPVGSVKVQKKAPSQNSKQPSLPFAAKREMVLSKNSVKNRHGGQQAREEAVFLLSKDLDAPLDPHVHTKTNHSVCSKSSIGGKERNHCLAEGKALRNSSKSLKRSQSKLQVQSTTSKAKVFSSEGQHDKVVTQLEFQTDSPTSSQGNPSESKDKHVLHNSIYSVDPLPPPFRGPELPVENTNPDPPLEPQGPPVAQKLLQTPEGAAITT